MKAVCHRWVIFAALFALSLFAPAVLLNFSVLPVRAERWLLFWIVLAQAPEGFISLSSGSVYLHDSARLLALVFWAAVGLAYALVMRRVALRYVVLGAYPVMFACLWVVIVVLDRFGLAHYAPSF